MRLRAKLCLVIAEKVAIDDITNIAIWDTQVLKGAHDEDINQCG